VQPRPFTWNDVTAVYALMARWRAALDPRACMHLGDMYWTTRASERDPTADAWVWERAGSQAAGSLAAFGWLDAPFHDDVAIDPVDGPPLDEALAFLEHQARACDRASIGLVVIDGDVAREEALRARGYVRGGDGNTRMWRQVEATPTVSAMPDGYQLLHVETDTDFEQRAFVECDAFGGAGFSGEAWRAFVDRLPNYRTDLDLLAIAADGGGVSAATFWYDDETRCGEIEAVGTAKAHLRRGVGKGVITEGLRRLHALGATTAVVQTTIGDEPAIALYQSCGFEIAGHDYAWTKAL
jgi:ribosomal protein S18 acetylase RimI-like enzyme